MRGGNAAGNPARREGYEKGLADEDQGKGHDRKGMEAPMQRARTRAISNVHVRNMAANTLVEAESHEAAAKMFALSRKPAPCC